MVVYLSIVKQCDVVILEDGEQYKNQQSLFAIYEALIQNKHQGISY